MSIDHHTHQKIQQNLQSSLNQIEEMISSKGSGGGHQRSSKPQMNPRLAQCYYALPDLEDIRYAIDTWFEHELVDTRSYVTEEEMYDLYDRVNQMKATSIELAFLYTFLIAAGAASLTQTTKKSKQVLESLYSIKSARRFAGMIFELITLDQIEQQQNASKQSVASTSAATQNDLYDWQSLSKCPVPLLHSRLHSMLCCFFHQARDETRSITHGNHAVRFARKYGLFVQIEEAKEEMANSVDGKLPSTSKYTEAHIYALQRLQFDLTVYPRLSMSIHPNSKKNKGKGKQVEGCILLDSEACQDPSLIASTRKGQKLSPLAFDFQCLKLILSEIRATAFYQCERELRMNEAELAADQEADIIFGSDPTVRAEARRMRKKEQAALRSSRAVANDDVVLALMDLLPSWTKVDVRANWMQESYHNVLDAGSIINMLWARYSCNRLRTENLMQTYDEHEMSWELQSRALSAAQDTIYLLAQVRQLLRTPFQFASAREWLFSEAEWAVNVFNQLMQIEITRELDFPFSGGKEGQTSQTSQTGSVPSVSGHSPKFSPHNVTPVPSTHGLSRESTPGQPSASITSADVSRRSSGTRFDTSSSSTDRRLSDNTSSTSENPNLSLQIHQRRKAIGGQESGEHFISMQVAATKVIIEAAEEEAKMKTYKGFAWFIFGFQGIYGILQDLHCFGPAAFEASRVLLRIQNPPKPMSSPTLSAESEKVLLEGIYQYNAKVTGRSPPQNSNNSVPSSPKFVPRRRLKYSKD